MSGNGLIAFSDPAGAKLCLALAYMLHKERQAGALMLASNKAYDFYNDWETPVVVTAHFDLDTMPFRPDWIFTGTSHPDSSGRFELEILEQAAGKNIPTYSFVDHWSNLLLRFKKEDTSVIFPDTVFVLDENAKCNAIGEGIPESVLAIRENPYLQFISTYWTPKKTKAEIFKELTLTDTGKKVVLYAPDPISLRNENKIWNFDEASALQDLLAALDHNDAVLLIKLHPLQPKEVLTTLIENARTQHDIDIRVVTGIDNLELIAIADLVVGFHSNFLIEADALGKKIFRYFPGDSGIDHLGHLNIGQKFIEKALFKQAINTVLC